MLTYLPHIQQLFPGAGVTVWNVWSVPVRWWERYVLAVDEAVTEAKQKRRRG